MRTCSKCKTDQDISEFNKRSDGCSQGKLESWCKTCKGKTRNKWYQANKFTPRSRYTSARSGAKARKLEFTIDEENYSKLISQLCYYCNSSLASEIGTGLDRLDSNLGYVLENVVTCCGRCNISRNENFTPEEWKYLMMMYNEYRTSASSSARAPATGVSETLEVGG